MILPLFLAQAPAPTPPPIRDISPPVDVFPYPPWVVYTAIAVLLVIVAVAVWLFIRWWRRRPKTPPPTPREIALAALEKARAQIGPIDPYAFSILVSDILRRYVSSQYHLHATEQTSPEFLASISNIPSFSAAEKTQLAVFLEKCDLIKFARMAATNDDSSQLLEQAIQFVKGGV